MSEIVVVGAFTARPGKEDDAAEAFLRAGASDSCNGEVFNVGGDRAISHRDLTALLIDVAGSGSPNVR